MTAVEHLPRVALTRDEAAKSLGISLTTFEERIQSDLNVVRLGRRIIVPVSELELWVARNAERILNGTA